MVRFLGWALLALGLVAGCGDAGGADSGVPPPKDRVPITARAVAAIMLEHLPDHPVRVVEGDFEPRSAHPVGAEVSYRTDRSRNTVVRVSAWVRRGQALRRCPPYGRCVRLPTDEKGATLYLVWDVEEPEEDPGIVELTLVRDDESTGLDIGGPIISQDPRRQHLSIPVDTLVEVVTDPRLRLRTSQAAVDAGDAVHPWRGR